MTPLRLWLAIVSLLLPGAVLTAQEVSGELKEWHDAVMTFRGPRNRREGRESCGGSRYSKHLVFRFCRATILGLMRDPTC
jgi:hypothetical protein